MKSKRANVKEKIQRKELVKDMLASTEVENAEQISIIQDQEENVSKDVESQTDPLPPPPRMKDMSVTVKPAYRSKINQTKNDTRSIAVQCDLWKENARASSVDAFTNTVPIDSIQEVPVTSFGNSQRKVLEQSVTSVRSPVEAILPMPKPSSSSSAIRSSVAGSPATDDDEWLQKSIARSDRSDPDFCPSDQEDSKLILETTKAYDFKNDRVLLVYESKLKQLLRLCQICGGCVIDIQNKIGDGTQYRVELHCINGCVYRWSSQPLLGAAAGAGNLMVTAAADMVGIPFPKLKRFAFVMNLKMIEKTTFYRLRGQYVFPEINKAWSLHRKKLISEMKSAPEKISLGVDGQCDSPGHSATYCTVTSMDTKTNKVLDVEVVNVKEVKSSQAMEKEGFIRTVTRLDSELSLNAISTDRHTQIRKLMATDSRFEHLVHQFDPWHIAKGISKKLVKLAKKKPCKMLNEWIPSIVNHVYWSVQTCEGNGEELAERLLSVVHHICNRHSFPGNKFYKKCEHDKYTEDEVRSRNWLQMGSPPHEALKKVLLQPQLVKDIKKMNLNIFTTYLEIFHSLKIRYLPKSIFFEQEKMEAGVKLAALDHNLNIKRNQATKTTKEGSAIPRFKIAYHRYSKRFVAKKVLTEKSYSFLRNIAVEGYFKALDRQGSKQKGRKRLFITPVDRPDRNETIESSTKYSRKSECN